MSMQKQRERSWPWWRCTLISLIALALLSSAYLSWHSIAGGAVIGCSGGSTCEQVLASRWSSIGGVLPVAGLAVGTYLAMFVAVLFIGPSVAPADRRLAWGALLILSGAAAGSAVWFFILQKWLVGAFCPYCVATHIVGLLVATLIAWQASRQISDHATASQPLLRRASINGFSMIGVALAAMVATTQVVFAPPPAYRSGESANARPAMDLRAGPLVGSPNAEYVVALLFDYRCVHCQRMHAMLDEVIRRYDGKIAFALCPAPLNNACNPYIPRYVEEFRESCDLARIGLAVWLADHEAFAAFDAWMFSPDADQAWHARSLYAAQVKAAQLIGQPKLDAALADPWIGQHLQDCVRAYGQTINPDQSGAAVPKLIFGPRWVTPEPHDANDLITILHDSLGLPRP